VLGQPAVKPQSLKWIVSFALASAVFSSELRTALAEVPRPRVRLHYEVDAPSCSTKGAMEAAVRERLGYDPFDATSLQEVRASLRRADGRLTAAVSIRGADGVLRVREPLTSSGSDCTEIAAALALAISIAIDPLTFVRAPPPPASTPEVLRPHVLPRASEETLLPSAKPEPVLPAPRADAPAYRAGAGIVGSVGSLPSPAWGPLIWGAFTFGRFGLEADGRYELPVSAPGPNGGVVRASRFTGTLAPCFGVSFVSLCGLASAGALFGEGRDVDVPATDTTWIASLGGRIGVALPARGVWRARVHIDGSAPLAPTRLRITNAEAWTTPPVVVVAGLLVTLGS